MKLLVNLTMPDTELSIGDRVMINPHSEVADGTPSNPLNIKGLVIEINSEDPWGIVVQWDNGYINDYHYNDLIKV